jgi:subtilisin family serine protease
MRRLSTFAVLWLALSVPAVHAGTVTLITGDQVTLEEGTPSKISIAPRKGRENIRFVTQHETIRGQQHLIVIPEDAGTLIASGRLDLRLFDITELLESQFDDAGRNTLPIIVTYPTEVGALSASSASIAGASKTRELRVINGVAAEARKEDVSALWDSLASGAQAKSASSTAVKKIWLDRLLKPVLDQSVPQIGAPAAWEQGYDGRGVRVAVVDGGVDTTHPDLAGKVVAARDFTGAGNIDTVGHGTHVASIIAGSGAASAGRYRGVAPGAEIINAKVCTSGCPISAILAGIEWAVTEEGAKIVNISLGSANTPEIDPVEEAVNTLTEDYGALFVIAAGNSGGFMTVSSPSTADAALSVAAVDRSDVIAPFSSRGPRAEDKAIKPEISAPGVAIVAARAAGTSLGTPLNDSYTAVSGTSMAAPHVAGAAAILAQLHPDYTPAQLKAVLMGSSRASVGPVFAHGAGRVDIPAAIAAAVSAEPASMNFGTALCLTMTIRCSRKPSLIATRVRHRRL